MPSDTGAPWFLPYEDPDVDSPTSTLNGGPVGTHPILAQETHVALNTLQTSVTNHESRITALEAIATAARWRHITSGTGGAGSNGHQLAVPAGFLMLRLSVWGDLSAGPNDVMLRVNGDTGNNHVWGLDIRAADGTTTSYSHSGAGSSAWRIGRWATTENNNSLVHVFPTDGNSNPSYQALAARQSTTASGHQKQRGYGKYLGDVVVSELQIIADSTTFASVGWVLEGYLAS